MFAQKLGEVLLFQIAGDQPDYMIAEGSMVGGEQLPAVGMEEGFGRGQSRALVALAERMISYDSYKQSRREDRNVAFPVAPMVVRTGEGAFQKTGIAYEERLASQRHQLFVDPGNQLGAEPGRLIRQGAPSSWDTAS